MREGAILAALVDFQIPDYTGEQDNRRLYEEIALLLHPRFIEVEHDGVCRFVSIGNILHEVRVNGVATVAAAGVVEVNHVELRLNFVAV